MALSELLFPTSGPPSFVGTDSVFLPSPVHACCLLLFVSFILCPGCLYFFLLPAAGPSSISLLCPRWYVTGRPHPASTGDLFRVVSPFYSSKLLLSKVSFTTELILQPWILFPKISPTGNWTAAHLAKLKTQQHQNSSANATRYTRYVLEE